MVSGLVLIDCSRNTAKLGLGDRLLLRLTRPLFALYPWPTLVEQSARSCGNLPATQDYMRDCFRRMGKRRLVEVMMSVLTCLHEDRDYRFSLPVLLLCGEDDPTGNIRRTVGAWEQMDPKVKLVMIPQAAHNANQDNPLAVNSAIKNYLSRHSMG
jgi:pimeloyl-ACP methyl ester carboxylesterase